MSVRRRLPDAELEQIQTKKIQQESSIMTIGITNLWIVTLDLHTNRNMMYHAYSFNMGKIVFRFEENKVYIVESFDNRLREN